MKENKYEDDSIATQIAGLPKLDNVQLKKLWRDLYNKEPPKLSRLLIIQKLAWRIQEIAFGTLEKAAQKQLEKDLEVLDRKSRITKVRIEQTKPGVIFERIWNGRIYRVKSLEKGFEYEGKWYRSLTAIAKHITGSHTSGPRFFGVKSGRKNVYQS